MNLFERYLTVWVGLCIVGGILLGKFAPEFAHALDGMAIYVNGAPVVSIPIAVCLFMMMYPIRVKIDFHEVVRAGKAVKPVGLTLFINWCVKPFTMYAIASFFLGTLFLGVIGPDEVDLVKMPLGEDLAVGDTYGAGRVVLVDGIRMLEVPLWRSYLAGCILLGIAPCTAMVLVWGYLSKGNDGHTLVMVAINSLTMLVLFGFFVTTVSAQEVAGVEPVAAKSARIERQSQSEQTTRLQPVSPSSWPKHACGSGGWPPGLTTYSATKTVPASPTARKVGRYISSTDGAGWWKRPGVTARTT